MRRALPALATALLGVLCLAAPAAGQSWALLEPGMPIAAAQGAQADGAEAGAASEAADIEETSEGAEAAMLRGPVAEVCGGAGAAVCLSLGCGAGGDLHYELLGVGARAGALSVPVEVGGRVAGVLSFSAEGVVARPGALRGLYDPEMQGEVVRRLRQGNQAALVLPGKDAEGEDAGGEDAGGEDAGGERVTLSLRGSSRALGAVLEACPEPIIPVTDPGRQVLREVRRACAKLGGEVSVEPGFLRREDLDGDGVDDFVVEYAAARCSERATLFCGAGGCTVGFYLSRGEAFEAIHAGVIRGYDVEPGGVLALDLHGSECGLSAYEGCRKRFETGGAALTLIEVIGGPRAVAAAEGRPYVEGVADAAGGAGGAGGAGAGQEAGEKMAALAADAAGADTGEDTGADTAQDMAAAFDAADRVEGAAEGAAEDGVEETEAPDEAGDEGVAEAAPEAGDARRAAAADMAGVQVVLDAPGGALEGGSLSGSLPGAGTVSGSVSGGLASGPVSKPAPALVANSANGAPEAAPVLDAVPAAPEPRREWMGDGGPVAIEAPALQGEQLPDDL